MKNMIMAAGGAGTLALAALALRPTGQPAFAHADGPVMEEIGSMTVPRAVHQATLLTTGEVLITGGCTGMCDGVHSSVEIYSPRTRAFRSVAPMSEPRAGHVALRLSDGRVLVAGGWNGRGATAAAEVFDPATGEWTSVGGMDDARMNPFAATLPDGRILVGGGTFRTRQPLASAEVFDPATDAFSRTAPMHAPRGAAVATSLEDGRILVSGGHDGRQTHRSVEIYDPSTHTFRPAGTMTFPRDRHAAVRLPNSTVLLIGGLTQNEGDPYPSTEIYDPATGRFVSGPTMRWGRRTIIDAVVVLPSGAVLVAGGWRQPEVWRPGGAEFVPVAGGMYGHHEFATATLLDSGDVLILGGYAVRPAERAASAWLVRAMD